MYFDAHTHIASSPKSYKDISKVIERAKAAGVEKAVDAGIDLSTSEAVLDQHLKYPDFIIPTIGLQPELVIPGSDIYDPHIKMSNIDRFLKKMRNLYEKGEGKYKVIGECGLDYYWVERGDKRIANSEQLNRVRKLQKELFRKQIEFASEVSLPLVVHSRGAEAECLKIINEKLKIKNDRKQKVEVLFHSFTGSIEVAKEVFGSGYYISFNGILTYPSADDIREIFKFGWKNFRHLILSETDAPYLTPQCRRGATCETSDVEFVVEKMAEIVETSVEEVAKTVLLNAGRFYSC